MSSKLTSLFKHEKPTNTTEAVKRPSTRTGSKRKGDGESSTDAQIRSQGEAAVTNSKLYESYVMCKLLVEPIGGLCIFSPPPARCYTVCVLRTLQAQAP